MHAQSNSGSMRHINQNCGSAPFNVKLDVRNLVEEAPSFVGSEGAQPLISSDTLVVGLSSDLQETTEALGQCGRSTFAAVESSSVELKFDSTGRSLSPGRGVKEMCDC